VLALIATLLSRFASAEQTPWMHIPENSFDQGWGLLDLSRLRDTGHWQEQRSLTGSWDGAREQLYKEGIASLGSYESALDTRLAARYTKRDMLTPWSSGLSGS